MDRLDATAGLVQAGAWPAPAPLLLEPGRPGPLGVHWDGQGLNIAVVSNAAHAVEFCLIDATGQTETHRANLPGCTQDVWHGYLRAAAPGSTGPDAALGRALAEPVAAHGQPQSVRVDLPPLACVFFEWTA